MGGNSLLTNSDLYMWESTEDAQEFESDLIASTNEHIYTNKQLLCQDNRDIGNHDLYPEEMS